MGVFKSMFNKMNGGVNVIVALNCPGFMMQDAVELENFLAVAWHTQPQAGHCWHSAAEKKSKPSASTSHYSRSWCCQERVRNTSVFPSWILGFSLSLFLSMIPLLPLLPIPSVFSNNFLVNW